MCIDGPLAEHPDVKNGTAGVLAETQLTARAKLVFLAITERL